MLRLQRLFDFATQQFITVHSCVVFAKVGNARKLISDIVDFAISSFGGMHGSESTMDMPLNEN